MTDLMVNVSRTVNAPINKVFDAWLDAKTLSSFMLPMRGMPNPKTVTDPEVGGTFTIDMQAGDNVIPHSGKYLEINRPDKLVFTWESPFSAPGSTVTILFSSVSEKETMVELSHIKFNDEESRGNHENGWGNILLSLDEQLTELTA